MAAFSAVFQFVMKIVVVIWLCSLIFVAAHAKDYVIIILKVLLKAYGLVWCVFFMAGVMYYIFSDESKVFVLPMFLLSMVGLLPFYFFRKKQEPENKHTRGL